MENKNSFWNLVYGVFIVMPVILVLIPIGVLAQAALFLMGDK